MADDDIKSDAEGSAEEVETVAAETTAEGGSGEAPTKQPEAAVAEQPSVADDTAEVTDAKAADSNLSGSDDDGAEQSESEDGASDDGNDAPAAESPGVASDTDGDMGAESAELTESAESSDAGDSSESEGPDADSEDSEEDTAEENLPPARPRPPLKSPKMTAQSAQVVVPQPGWRLLLIWQRY